MHSEDSPPSPGRSTTCLDASVRSPPECNAALACPHCNYNYLHHHRIIVYEREHGKEDAEYLIKTTIDNSISVETVRAQDSGNPSSRRDGLLIGFWCEGCDARPELSIEQHKGQTFFRWREI
jgi:hypothetical protein